MEDQFWCSGMCRAGLFYFSKDIAYGPPVRTCLSKMKHEIDETTRPYAWSAMITGFCCLFLFFMHFGLYCRPESNTDRIERYEEPVAIPTTERNLNLELAAITSPDVPVRELRELESEY